jgi:hypothetical protein
MWWGGVADEREFQGIREGVRGGWKMRGAASLLAAEARRSIFRSTPDGILTLRVLEAERSGELLRDLIWDDELVSMVIIDDCQLVVGNMCSRDFVDNDVIFHKIGCVDCDSLKAFAGVL